MSLNFFSQIRERALHLRLVNIVCFFCTEEGVRQNSVINDSCFVKLIGNGIATISTLPL